MIYPNGSRIIITNYADNPIGRYIGRIGTIVTYHMTDKTYGHLYDMKCNDGRIIAVWQDEITLLENRKPFTDEEYEDIFV